MEYRPKRGKNAGDNLQKKTKDEDRRQRQVKRDGNRVEQRGHYLEVKMNKKLTWGSHIEYARQKARATRAKLYPMTSRTFHSSSRFFNHTWPESSVEDLTEVHHRNGKDQAEGSEDIPKSRKQLNQLLQEAVNYDAELKAPYKRLRYQLLDNG